MESSGFVLGRTAFFSALGVTQFLTMNAVDALIGNVASLRSGSEFVFSFAVIGDELDGDELAESKASAARTGSGRLVSTTA
jgi:O-methyltransferase involved in polyketide biosynthesis